MTSVRYTQPGFVGAFIKTDSVMQVFALLNDCSVLATTSFTATRFTKFNSIWLEIVGIRIQI